MFRNLINYLTWYTFIPNYAGWEKINNLLNS